MAQPGWQDLLELGQRPDRRLLDPGHTPGRGRAQPDGDGDRLVVVEQQRRQRGSSAQPVAGHSWHGIDRIAEVAELVDVATNRPYADAHLLGQRSTAPIARGLQQGEQLEQPSRGFQHVLKSAS